MASLVKRLMQQGLVARVPSPQDRRAFGLVMTDAGKSFIDGMNKRALDLDRRYLAGLSDHERRTLIDLMSRVHATLDQPFGPSGVTP